MIVTATIPFVPINVLADEIITTAVVSDDGFSGLETRYDNNIAPTLDELTIFAFDTFTNQGNWDHEDAIGILPAAALTPDRMARPLPVDPIFSGLAEPGTTLVLRIYDESGRLLGDRQVVADVGGNWLATFPGTVIWKEPHRMEIEQVASIENANEDGGFNLRRYFHPASHHSLFMPERPTVSGVIRDSASETIEAMHEAHNNPLHLGLKSHLYQLNTASTNAAQK